MPEFLPGESKTAIATMSNPTPKAFDYIAELYMGTDLALMAQTPFHLDAGEEKDISLPVTMPGVAGTYPVFLGVFSDGQFIEPVYQAEDVVIAVIPILVAGLHYVYRGMTFILGTVMNYPEEVTHIGFRFANNGTVNIDNVSLKLKIIDGGTQELSPPRDQWNVPISQPFTLAPGSMDVWYLFTPIYPYDYTAVAEVWVGDTLVASASLYFEVNYPEVPPEWDEWGGISW